MDMYYEIGYGFSIDTKISLSNFTLPLIFEVENVKNAKNQIFLFQMITLCYKVVSINNFQRQSCSSRYLEWNQSWKPFRKRCIFTLFTTISKLCIFFHYLRDIITITLRLFTEFVNKRLLILRREYIKFQVWIKVQHNVSRQMNSRKTHKEDLKTHRRLAYNERT